MPIVIVGEDMQTYRAEDVLDEYLNAIEQELARQRTVVEEVIERAADLYRALAKL